MEPLIEQTKKEIANAASEAVKLIAVAADSAAHAVASAAADAKKITSMSQWSDHDLLTELKTEFKVRMDWLKSDIADIKSGTAKRIDSLELNKLDYKDSYVAVYKKSNDDVIIKLDDRMKIMETSKNTTNVLLSIGIGLMFILASMLIYHLFGASISTIK